MKPVVFHDSPLALYLEGEGEDDREWSSTVYSDSTGPAADPSSFAPRGPPTRPHRFHMKPRLRNLNKLASNGPLGRFLNTCSNILGPKLGLAEKGRFLEEFRYTIIASQLLNEKPHIGPSKREDHFMHSHEVSISLNSEKSFVAVSWPGPALVAASAFALVWSIHWSRSAYLPQTSKWRILLVPVVTIILYVVLGTYFQRHWLRLARIRSVESASSLVASAHTLNATASASISFIQEVELVSRGYKIGSPLPPATRIEEPSNSKKCLRLRRTVQRQLNTLSISYNQAFQRIKQLAVQFDLEQYCDIYDISMRDAENLANARDLFFEEGDDTIKHLKIQLQGLHIVRKLLLCSLLALNTSNNKTDSTNWRIANDTMNKLTEETITAVNEMDGIMGDEEEFLAPEIPPNPQRERTRNQLKRLSLGIREVRAKLHVLWDAVDKEVHGDFQMVLTQFDSVAKDLKLLLQEWEEGRAVLTRNIEHERPLEVTPASPTSDLEALTNVDEHQVETSTALKEVSKSDESCISASRDGFSEEIFEAVAAPRRKIDLTREQRIEIMKDERAKTAIAKSKADTSTHMLKELETVIKRRHVLEARLEQAQLLKKVVDAIKDLVQDCNFDCNDSGIALQAMDNSHVALVSMMLKAESFSPFRCDRNIALGINLTSLMKVLRCAQNEDILTLKADDAPDVVNLVFESAESDRLSEYDIKLMDIDQEHLGIPETDYAARISMPSAEFQRICRDLMALSESVSIEATKDGVKFSCMGDIGSGAVTLRSHTNVENPEKNIDISLTEPVALTFSLKYLVNFCKASGLSQTVKLCLSNEVPLLVEYSLAANSYLRFYLAPKIGDEE